MATSASLPIAADRAGPCIRTIQIVGIDLTDVAQRLEVRMQPDNPVLLFALGMAANAASEGLFLVGAETVDGLPTSTVQIRIAKATMQDPSKVPYTGELGDASVLAYGWSVTIGGDDRQLASGSFTAVPTVIGAGAAPVNRPATYSAGYPSGGVWNGAELTFSNDAVAIAIDGAPLLAPLVSQAGASSDAAAVSQAAAAGSALGASLSAGAAAAFIGGVMFATPAAGLAATPVAGPTNGFFVVKGDGTNTYASLYQNVAGAAQQVADYVSKAAYQGATGATLIGHQPNGTATPVTIDVQMKRFGGWPTLQAELQAYANALVAAGSVDTINLRSGLIIPVTGAGLSLDHSFVRLLDYGATLDGSGMTGGTILSLGGSVDPPYRQSRNSIQVPLIVGPDQNSTVVGIALKQSGTPGNGPSHLELIRPAITVCGIGIQIADHSYLIAMDMPDINGCGVGIDILNADDSGENIGVKGGAIFNGGIALRCANPDADVYLDTTSLDFNTKLVELTGGTIALANIHAEASDYPAPPITITGNGANVSWKGGVRLLDAPPGGRSTAAVWVTVDTDGHYEESGVFAHGDATATGAFASGPGHFAKGRTKMLGPAHENCFLAHATRSRFIDPTFATMSDMAWVAAAFGQTDRYTDSHPASGVITTIAASANGLVYTKQTFGGGAQSLFNIAIPAGSEDELVAGQLAIAKAGALTGTLYVSRQWVRIDPVAAGSIPAMTPIGTAIDATSVSFTSAAYASTLIFGAATSAPRRPGGATHMVLTFNGASLGMGSFTVNGFNFDRIG